ncbi:MAG: sensor histidine kinase [Rhizobiales bacterium]|nr:sensor histidine kinase [Hyphomicrobiales bacterium]
MLKTDHGRDASLEVSDPTSPQEVLAAENVSLRLLLTQAKLSAETLLAQAGIEARERDAADKLQKLILEELHHRIKNTLATVGAIASQSLRSAPSTQHAQHAIEGRLQALGRAHDLLLLARWTGADLRKIVHGATEPFDNPDKPRFSIVGPDVQTASGAVIAIAMTLNELCTNTTKFGALSVPAGHVAISWAVDSPGSRLHFTWKEQGGPPVVAPTRQSFGTRLIETLGRQLKGIVKLTYEPSGFVYFLDIPLLSLES